MTTEIVVRDDKSKPPITEALICSYQHLGAFCFIHIQDEKRKDM